MRLCDTHRRTNRAFHVDNAVVRVELAVQSGVKSIAFCCISTGVFGFPQDKAAEIAVQTVREFLKDNDIEVIFNVFTEKDYEIYSGLLG